MEVLEQIVAPLIEADGGELYVAVDEASATLHVAGAFSGCPGTHTAYEQVIEPALRAAAPGLDIQFSSGALRPEGTQLLSSRSPSPK